MIRPFTIRLLALYTWLCYFCTTYIKPVLRKVWVKMWTGETYATRFWLGGASLMFAIFIFKSPLFDYYNAEYHLMAELSPYWIQARFFWGILFVINGLAILYGLAFNKYNTLLLILESLLGVALWGSSAIAVYYAQATVGAHTLVAFIALWLLARYPTHSEYVVYEKSEEGQEKDRDELLRAMHLLAGEDNNDS